MADLDLMKPFGKRPLTAGERAALSPGLSEALTAAKAWPTILARPSLPALIASLWRGRAPVMVLGRKVFWPGAAEDFSTNPLLMSVLQHELQHALEFAEGRLSRLGYLFAAKNWIYGYRLEAHSAWDDFGAEQRAMIVQHYWLAGRGLLHDSPPLDRFRALIPWAR